VTVTPHWTRIQVSSIVRCDQEEESVMTWEILKRGSDEFSSEILAIHAAMLPTNQILLFGGDEFNPDQHPAAVDNSRLFNLRGWQGPVGFGGDHLKAGASVSPAFEQSPGVFAALTVDKFGRMNVTWLDTNVPNPGWQGPVGFGNNHLAPGGPVSPVFAQSPGVFAALTVDKLGRMNVTWLDTNVPNPGWQGPVGFGNNHLAPGAPVSPVFAQSPGVFAALTVDKLGRMNVTWLDMNVPNPGWQGPVGFGGNHLKPGAPVSPVFAQSPGVFAALTVDKFGRMNVTWLDTNVPNPGWQGPVGFGGDHLAPGAPVSPVFEQRQGLFAALTVDKFGRMNVTWLDMNVPNPGWQGPTGFGGDHLAPGAPVGPVFAQSSGVFAALTVDRFGRMNVTWMDNAGYSLETVGSPTTDLFCCGHVFLADGRLLVVGGTEGWPPGAGEFHSHYDGFSGEKACWTYEPWARRWRRAASLNGDPGEPPRLPNPDGGGRWYPGVVTLANGDVVTVSGHPDDRDRRGHNNDQPERYSPSANVWKLQPGERLDRNERDRFYPRMHMLPDGNVFLVSPVTSTVPGTPSSDPACRVYDPVSGLTVGTPSPAPVSGHNLYSNTYSYTSVLLPLLPGDDYRPRVLICGRKTPRRIDFPKGPPWEPVPTWRETAQRGGAAAGKLRMFCTAVILPTGEIFVSGGLDGSVLRADGSITERVDAEVDYPDTRIVKHAELYSPGIDWSAGGRYEAPDSWRTIDEAHVPRNYHSTALLMPDGRVWTAGSSKNHGLGDPQQFGEFRIELWKPPYDHDPKRPDLTAAPASIGYGQSFAVHCTQAAQIGAVALIRCGSSTHGFDFDQRYVGLKFRHVEGDRLDVESPPHNRIAPPGYYLLWVLDEARLPCKFARFVRVGSGVTPGQEGKGWQGPIGFGEDRLAPGAWVGTVFEQSPGAFAALTIDKVGQMNVAWLDMNQPAPGWQGPVGFGRDHLTPGAHVSPVFEQTSGVFAALTVDRLGRMNVTWLDMNVPNPGWQGPVGFGGDHLAPGAPVSPVFAQSPGVFAALTVDAHGRMNVTWLDMNVPNPGWQGPAGFGGDHLAPGAPVSPVFEQSPGVFAALTVDRLGTMNVTWLDMNTPSPGWKGPVGFGGNHLTPGAPVSPIFEQSAGVFAALTVDKLGRMNVTWLDMNVPNPGWQGPVGFGGDHLAPGAPVSPVFEQSPGVFAALTVDRLGRMNVTWLDMNVPNPGWQGPVGFGGDHLAPGAPVSPVFAQSPGVFAALTVDRLGRMNVTWLDMNVPDSGWQGPVGFGGNHLAPGAPVSPVFAQSPGVFAALTVDARGRMNVTWLDTN
jgi:hypothetical protein